MKSNTEGRRHANERDFVFFFFFFVFRDLCYDGMQRRESSTVLHWVDFGVAGTGHMQSRHE